MKSQSERLIIPFTIILFLISIFMSCTSTNTNSNKMDTNGANIYHGAFGTCCQELKDAMDTTKVPNSFFLIGENGVFYQTVGYVNTEKGPGFFDQAVIFCPFCGKKLQDKDVIKGK